MSVRLKKSTLAKALGLGRKAKVGPAMAPTAPAAALLHAESSAVPEGKPRRDPPEKVERIAPRAVVPSERDRESSNPSPSSSESGPNRSLLGLETAVERR